MVGKTTQTCWTLLDPLRLVCILGLMPSPALMTKTHSLGRNLQPQVGVATQMYSVRSAAGGATQSNTAQSSIVTCAPCMGTAPLPAPRNLSEQPAEGPVSRRRVASLRGGSSMSSADHSSATAVGSQVILLQRVLSRSAITVSSWVTRVTIAPTLQSPDPQAAPPGLSPWATLEGGRVTLTAAIGSKAQSRQGSSNEAGIEGEGGISRQTRLPQAVLPCP